MNVLIVGLGLMGGAYAQRLIKKDYKVYGFDVNDNAIIYAYEHKYIINNVTPIEELIIKADLIILCIYPQAILNFLEKYHTYFNEKQIITDICGVKSSFINEATKIAMPAIYCSHHPMAGREKIGIKFSSECIFEVANFLITPLENTPKEVVDVIKKLGSDLGFVRITSMSYLKHDKMIGFTSQLTHAIAVSLVNSDHDSDTKNYIGDSYRDLTRIAMINEDLWCELFLENKDFLLEHIKSFEYELDLLKDALANNDKQALKELFKSSTKIRRGMEKWEN